MTRILLKRATADVWTMINPTLADGEPGYETDTNKFKIGDGTSPWTSLSYQGGGGGGGSTPSLGAVLAQSNDAGGFVITDLSDPSSAQDAATKHYVDSSAPGLAAVLDISNDAGGSPITNLSGISAGEFTGDEFDVVQMLVLVNIPITSTPVTLPIDSTPSPMYTCGAGASVVNVDSAAVTQKTIWFKNITQDTVMTLVAAAGESIDGFTSYDLQPGAGVQLWSDGAGAWWVVDSIGWAWSQAIRWPANPNGGVLLRDDWDGPGSYGDGWLGVIAPAGGAFGLGAGILLQSAQMPGQPPTPPSGTIGNFAHAIATQGQTMEDFSQLSNARYVMQMNHNGDSSLWGAGVGLQADDGWEALSGGLEPVITATRLPTGDLVWALYWSGAQSLYGDATFDTPGHGPVIVDQSDGHTYRIICTNGVLSTVQVS